MKSLSSTNAGSSGLAVQGCKLSRVAVCTFLFFLLCAFAVPAFSQEATIVGTVTDPSNATLPNVKVTLTNTDTGVSRTETTNADGQYVAPDIHIGHYIVRAEATGFKVGEEKGIVLQVGDRMRV